MVPGLVRFGTSVTNPISFANGEPVCNGFVSVFVDASRIVDT